jgi:hypothetical protein
VTTTDRDFSQWQQTPVDADFQKSRAFSPAVVTQGGVWLARQTALTDLDRKEKSAANVQNKNEGNLGQKEARIEKEKTSELASMGEKSVQSEKSD